MKLPRLTLAGRREGMIAGLLSYTFETWRCMLVFLETSQAVADQPRSLGDISHDVTLLRLSFIRSTCLS